MEKNAFLARIVSAAVLSGAMFGASQVSACDTFYVSCEPTTIVTAPEPEDPWVPTDSGYYDDPGDPTSGSSSGGNSNYDAYRCLQLQDMGLPTGCTAQLAAAGIPNNSFTTDFGLAPLNIQYYSFGLAYSRANRDLQRCYHYQWDSASLCEDAWISDLETAYGDNIKYPNAYTDGIFSDAMSSINFELWHARYQRGGYEVINFLSVGASLGGISLNIGGLLTYAFDLNQFNRLWAAVGKQKVCMLYRDAVQQNGCAISLP